MSDLIDRQAAIEILSERAESLRGEYGDLGGACRGAMRIIETLPSAEPERTAKVKKKRFLGTTTNTIGDFTSIGLCGNCDCEVNEHYTYCPLCGCRLEWN